MGADASDVLQDRCDIREHAEQAGRGQHAHAQRQQHVGLAQHFEFAGEVGFVHCDVFWQPQPLRQRRNNADHRHRPEGRAPASVLAKRCAEWHAEHVGQGQAGEHHGNGLRAFVRRHQAGGNHRANAEKRPMTQRRDHPRRHQRRVVGCQRAEHVAEDEHQRHAQQCRFARHIGGADRQDRCAEHHAQGVTGDQQPGVRNAHRQIAGDVGQQAHDDEFGGADAERGNGECKQSEGHAQGLCR